MFYRGIQSLEELVLTVYLRHKARQTGKIKQTDRAAAVRSGLGYNGHGLLLLPGVAGMSVPAVVLQAFS